MFVSLCVLIIVLLGCWLLFIYERVYKPYLDCQVPLDKINSVVDEKERTIIGETAVIIGASFTGLTSAAIMSKYYRRVILVERNQMIPDESIAKHRQGEQAHIFTYRCLQVWDKLLPGFLKELEESTRKNKLNQIVYPASEIKYHYKNGYGVSNYRHLRENPIIMASRGQIETILRERVRRDLKNVEIYDGYSVSVNGIKVESSVTSVGKSVRVKSVTISKTTSTVSDQAFDSLTFDCDLFVNCSGAGSSSMMKNLENQLSPNKKLLTRSSIDCKIRYQTIFFEPKDSSYSSDGKVSIYQETLEESENRKLNDPYYIVYHMLSYPNQRGILFMPHTHNLYLILLHTYNEKIGTIDSENAKEMILEFCKSNPEMERDANIMLEKFKDQPARIVPIYEKSGSEYIHYENLKNVRDFIAVGDCCGSLNPIYGQGATMSVDSVALLDDQIKKQLTKGEKDVFTPTFCHGFQSALCKSYLVPWLLCSTSDMRFDFAKYTTNLKFQKLISPILGWVTDRLFMSSHVSSNSSFHFAKILLMEDGFRKELINLYWLLGYVFRKETLLLTISVAVLITSYFNSYNLN